MTTKTYRVFLEGGDSFDIEAAGYTAGTDRLVFHDEKNQPLKEVLVKVDAVIAVVPRKKKKKKKNKEKTAPEAPAATPSPGA